MQITTESPTGWAKMISDNFITLSVSGAEDGFRASLSRCDLGSGVTLTSVGNGRSTVRRSIGSIRADGCNDLLLLAPIEGSVAVRQEGRESVLAPGSVSVHVGERPYELAFGSPGRVIVLQAPRATVPDPSLVSVERRCTAEGTRPGIAAAFRAFAIEVVGMADALGDSEREELGSTAAELAVSVLRSDAVAGTAGWRAILAQAQAFIRENLDNPRLAPAAVAVRQGISLRCLQLAFARAETSPAAFIREERLRRARRLLADPRYSALSISQVASRVGYPDANAFIRAFRAEQGTTPGAWRAQCGSNGSGRGMKSPAA